MFNFLTITILLASGWEIKSDEAVVFFPTAAWFNKETDSWDVPIHGWIFEPERNSWRREAVFELLGAQFQLDKDSAEEKLFRQRSAWLLVDNERDKQIQIRLGNKVYDLPKSAENGHFQTTLSIPSAEASLMNVTPQRDSSVEFTAVVSRGDQRIFRGQVHFLSPQGTSVVSDIDDTIKVSEVLDKKKLLEITFLKPFRATPGTIQAYQVMSKRGEFFHYVSSSPWQLFPDLYDFTKTAGYPQGSWQLKSFRTLDRSALNLLADPVAYKLAAIETLLKTWPERRFVLVGDTGEKDPEVYGKLARRFPQQIQQIWLRDVTGDAVDSARFRSAMREVAPENWHLFANGNEIVK